MTTKEQKPQLVRQDANLLNHLRYTWKGNGETMEFMGVEEERTFETMEYPDWERGVGFFTKKIWVPRPGPMKHFDKDGHLISEGTVDYVQTEHGRRLTHVGIMKKYVYENGKLLCHEEAEFPKEGGHAKWLRRYDGEGKLQWEETFYKNGDKKSSKYFDKNGELNGYWFTSKTGEIYNMENGKDENSLFADNINRKVTDRKARRKTLKRILSARQMGNNRIAQEIRHEFDEQKPKKTSSIIGRLVGLSKLRKKVTRLNNTKKEASR